VITTSRRFAYPFAPALSRGLEVPLTAITSLIALNQAAGILSPIFGPFGDRWGYRAMMLAGLSSLTLGMLAGGFLPFYGMVLVALFLVGLCKSTFDPALQAYVGEKVPYRRRGLIIGLIELSWAAASLVGIPLIGLLIERLGWRSPFFVLGGLGLLSTVALGLLLPTDRRHPHHSLAATNFGQAWRRLGQNRAALGALAFGFFVPMSNDNLFVIYGAWLEDDFALGIVALGIATSVIGVAELTGETLTATIADRLGLKRAVIIGAALSTLSYVLLPALGQILPLALIGLFAIFITFEFTVVTSFSLFTEVLPGARATMMSSLVAANSLGRMFGALIGGPLWLWGGLPAIGFISAVLSAAGLTFFLWGLRDWQID
jgi:predicted MFS family arabinose efflux permease